jgi:hypothetical protein
VCASYNHKIKGKKTVKLFRARTTGIPVFKKPTPLSKEEEKEKQFHYFFQDTRKNLTRHHKTQMLFPSIGKIGESLNRLAAKGEKERKKEEKLLGYFDEAFARQTTIITSAVNFFFQIKIKRGTTV